MASMQEEIIRLQQALKSRPTGATQVESLPQELEKKGFIVKTYVDSNYVCLLTKDFCAIVHSMRLIGCRERKEVKKIPRDVKLPKWGETLLQDVRLSVVNFPSSYQIVKTR